MKTRAIPPLMGDHVVATSAGQAVIRVMRVDHGTPRPFSTIGQKPYHPPPDRAVCVSAFMKNGSRNGRIDRTRAESDHGVYRPTIWVPVPNPHPSGCRRCDFRFETNTAEGGAQRCQAGSARGSHLRGNPRSPKMHEPIHPRSRGRSQAEAWSGRRAFAAPDTLPRRRFCTSPARWRSSNTPGG